MSENLDEQKIADRREFLKKAGKAAVLAPAVALLLKATSMPAHALATSGITTPGITTLVY